MDLGRRLRTAGLRLSAAAVGGRHDGIAARLSFHALRSGPDGSSLCVESAAALFEGRLAAADGDSGARGDVGGGGVGRRLTDDKRRSSVPPSRGLVAGFLL